MSTFINKLMDMFTTHARKIPQVLMVIFIFTFLFPAEAIRISAISVDKLNSILPEAITSFMVKLNLPQDDLLIIWTFCLITFAITFVLNCIHQLLEGDTNITLSSGADILLLINSIFLLSALIYNSLYSPGIKFSSIEMTKLYYFFVVFSLGLFILFFCITYCCDVILIIKKLLDECKYSLKRKILVGIVCLIIVSCIYSRIIEISII